MSHIQIPDLINFFKHSILEPDRKFKKSKINWLVLITGTQFLAIVIGFIANTTLIKLGFFWSK